MSSSQELGDFRSQNNPEAEAQRRYAHAALDDKTMRVIILSIVMIDNVNWGMGTNGID